MKPIFAKYILLLLAISLWAACNQAKQPDTDVDPAFKAVKAVESDNFLRYDSIPPDERPGTKPNGQLPNVQILRLPEGFSRGDFRARGRISTANDQLVFSTDKKETLAIRMDAPQRFSKMMQRVKDQEGTIAMRYNSSPGGADEQLQLSSGNQMVLGYIWQTSEKPLNLPGIDNRPLLSQVPLKEMPKGNSIADVAVQALSDSGAVSLTPGETVTIKRKGSTYQITVHSSIYLSQADEGEDGSTGYVLHAVVVQE